LESVGICYAVFSTVLDMEIIEDHRVV